MLPDTADQVMHNFAGEACGGTMLQLFTVSCDTGFAQLGLDVGGDALASEARRWGWDTTPARLARRRQSSFPAATSFVRNGGALAKSAIGQESVQAVPFTLALDAAAVANHGVDNDPTPATERDGVPRRNGHDLQTPSHGSKPPPLPLRQRSLA